MNMIKYLLKLKYIIVFQVFTALLSIVGIASMPYVVKLLFDYDFSKGAGGMIWIVFLYLLSIALGMFFEYCSQRSVWKFRQRFYCLVKQDLFEALLRKRYVDFKKHDLSDYLSFFKRCRCFPSIPGVLHHHLSDCSPAVRLCVFPLFTGCASSNFDYPEFFCKPASAEIDRKAALPTQGTPPHRYGKLYRHHP